MNSIEVDEAPHKETKSLKEQHHIINEEFDEIILELDEKEPQHETVDELKGHLSAHLEKLDENLKERTEEKHSHKYFEPHDIYKNIKNWLKLHVYMYEEIEPKGRFQ